MLCGCTCAHAVLLSREITLIKHTLGNEGSPAPTPYAIICLRSKMSSSNFDISSYDGMKVGAALCDEPTSIVGQ